MIDFVTVVFEEELDLLKKQARSLDLYATDVANIVVVVNENSDLHKKIDVTWWGQWQNNVQIIDRHRFGSYWISNGWVSQQALKLLAASISSSKWSIILDSKTFFVKPVPPVKNKPCVGCLPLYPVFDQSRQIVNKLFGLDLKFQLGPGGVPFIINTQQVQEMISWIEKQTNESFSAWFQKQGTLTEFVLYSGWILYNLGSLKQLYNTDYVDIFPSNLCHSEVDAFDRKFLEMQTSVTVSVHRRAWANLTKEQQNQYTNFLLSRGIQ